MKTKSYRLIFTSEARFDLKDAAIYYDSKLKGLGQRLKSNVTEKLSSLKENPLTHSVRYGSVRMATIDKFPYSIHYSVSENTIMVYAILCDYRNPADYWVKTDLYQ